MVMVNHKAKKFVPTQSTTIRDTAVNGQLLEGIFMRFWLVFLIVTVNLNQNVLLNPGFDGVNHC